MSRTIFLYACQLLRGESPLAVLHRKWSTAVQSSTSTRQLLLQRARGVPLPQPPTPAATPSDDGVDMAWHNSDSHAHGAIPSSPTLDSARPSVPVTASPALPYVVLQGGVVATPSLIQCAYTVYMQLYSAWAPHVDDHVGGSGGAGVDSDVSPAGTGSPIILRGRPGCGKMIVLLLAASLGAAGVHVVDVSRYRCGGAVLSSGGYDGPRNGRRQQEEVDGGGDGGGEAAPVPVSDGDDRDGHWFGLSGVLTPLTDVDFAKELWAVLQHAAERCVGGCVFVLYS